MNWKEEKDFLLLYYALWTKRTKELAEEKIQKLLMLTFYVCGASKRRKRKLKKKTVRLRGIDIILTKDAKL